MLKSSFFRQRASRALSGSYKSSIITSIFAFFTGGMGYIIPVLYFCFYGSILLFSLQTDWYQSLLNFFNQLLPFMGIYGFIISLTGPGIGLGLRHYFSELLLGHHVDITLLFPKLSSFGKALALKLLIFIKIFLWSLLLLVPGILAAYHYSMAPYILAENPNMKITEALSQSVSMMKRKKQKFFFLQLSFLGWLLFGIVTFGIGLLYVLPYMQASYAAFYIEISGQNKPFENYADKNSLDYI